MQCLKSRLTNNWSISNMSLSAMSTVQVLIIKLTMNKKNRVTQKHTKLTYPNTGPSENRRCKNFKKK